MSRFDDIMIRLGVPAILRQFGDALSYTPPAPADPVALTGVLATELIPVGDPYSERMEARWTLEVAADAGVAIGGTVTRDARTWTVTQVLTDDGIMTKFALRVEV